MACTDASGTQRGLHASDSAGSQHKTQLASPPSTHSELASNAPGNVSPSSESQPLAAKRAISERSSASLGAAACTRRSSASSAATMPE